MREAFGDEAQVIAELAGRIRLDRPGPCPGPPSGPAPARIRPVGPGAEFPTPALARAHDDGSIFVATYSELIFVSPRGEVSKLERPNTSPHAAMFVGEDILLARGPRGTYEYELVRRNGEVTRVVADPVLDGIFPLDLHRRADGRIIVSGEQGPDGFVAICSLVGSTLECPERHNRSTDPIFRTGPAYSEVMGDSIFVALSGEQTRFVLIEGGVATILDAPSTDGLTVFKSAVSASNAEQAFMVIGSASESLVYLVRRSTRSLRHALTLPRSEPLVGGYASGEALVLLTGREEIRFELDGRVVTAPFDPAALGVTSDARLHDGGRVAIDPIGRTYRTTLPILEPSVLVFGSDELAAWPRRIAAIEPAGAGAHVFFESGEYGFFDAASESISTPRPGPRNRTVTSAALASGLLYMAGYGPGLDGWVGRLDVESGELEELSLPDLDTLRGRRVLDLASDGRRVVAVGDGWTILVPEGSSLVAVPVEWDDPETPEVEGVPELDGGCSERASRYAPAGAAQATFRAVDANDGVAWAAGCSSVLVRVDLNGLRARLVALPTRLQHPFAPEDFAPATLSAIRAPTPSDVVAIVESEVNGAPPTLYIRGEIRAEGMEFERLDTPDPGRPTASMSPVDLFVPKAGQLIGVVTADSHGPMRGLVQGEGLELLFGSSESFSAASFDASGRLLIGAPFGRLFLGRPE